MSVDRCIVVAAANDGRAVELVSQRLDALVGFYGPLGPIRVSRRLVEAARAVVAVLDFTGRHHDLSAPVTFGAPLSGRLGDAAHLVSATPEQLRPIDGPSATVAVSGGRVRVITASGPPTTLYTSQNAQIAAWSSHAVAAAFLAHGRATVDASVLAEFLAAQFVGGSRTLIAEARAVDGATSVVVDERGSSSSSWWSLEERWRPVGPEAALRHTTSALLEDLPRRVDPLERPWCGLTVGLDSRVVAAALREAGRRVPAFTFGEPGWPDLEGAPLIARAFGMEHRACGFTWMDDAQALDAVRRDVRWTEGATHVGFGTVGWPAGMGAWVTGGGGETGRAFYYSRRRPAGEAASTEELTQALLDGLLWRIPGADDAALRRVRAAVAEWIDAARSSGHSGWRLLDVVYAEQRMRRWSRGTLSRETGVPLPAFGSREVQRGLLSLPLEDRLTSGFHRQFLARYAPETPVPGPVEGLPRNGLLRRGWDRLTRSAPARSAGPAAQPTAALLADRWSERPMFREWVADAVLRSARLEQGLGADWARTVRDRFLAGDGDAETAALWAAGPCCLAEELGRLTGPPRLPGSPPATDRPQSSRS